MAVQKQVGAFMDARPGSADLTGKEHYLVTRLSDGTVRLAQAGEVVAGVLQEGKASTYWSSFMTAGIAKCVASGAITPGQRVQAGGDGTCVAGATNPWGTARSSALSGEMVEIVMDQI